MPRRHELLFALNAGGLDPRALARVDQEKARIAGEHPVSNLLPEVLGPSSLRPGSELLARIPDDAQTRQLRFLRTTGTGYILLLSPGEMRVSIDGEIQQVPEVETEINSGSWSDQSSGSATATGGTTLTLNATQTATARLRQAVSVASGDQDKANVLRVVVSRGPVFLRIGTSAGSANLMPGNVDAELDTGTHKIAVTPGAGTIYVEVSSVDPVTRTVSEIQFESALLTGGTGDLVIPTPWTTWDQVEALRTWQSIDVVFCGDGVVQQQRIEHRGPLSWGVCRYRADDGPFVPGSTKITMTPSGVSGNRTITASEAYFQSGHVGALIELTQTGRTIQATFDGPDLVTDHITVVGVGNGRRFRATGVSDSFNGTVVLERSFEPSNPSIWSTYDTHTGSFSETYDDDQDNLTAHYRLRVSAYTSGSIAVTLSYDAGVDVGVGRITAVNSATNISVEVINSFGNTNATRQWRIGDWSDVRGWPRVPMIHDSRLHWFRRDVDYASLPDNYTSFDDREIGDSAPITRSVGSGNEEGVVWALTEQRLLAGTSGFEAVIAASEFDGPLTPTDYTVRKPSRRGCADIPAIEHDDGVFFVQRSRKKLYELAMLGSGGRYTSQNISRLNPAAFAAGIKRIAVQQQPDTRCWCVMDDGTLTIMTWEREDEVVAITTATIAGGLVEDIAILPDVDQDDIFLIVKRGDERYHERLAKEGLQSDPDTCALLDGHKVLTGSVSQITGATHFAGETVQVWADGKRHADVELDGSGEAELDGEYSRVVYGKSYTGIFKSLKLAYAAGLGAAVGQTKIVRGVGLILGNSCLDGIRVGPDADHLDPMPEIVDGTERTANQFFEHYDHDLMPINSDWNPDARIYVEVDSAEGPVTIEGIVIDIETRDGSEA